MSSDIFGPAAANAISTAVIVPICRQTSLTAGFGPQEEREFPPKENAIIATGLILEGKFELPRISISTATY